MSRIKYLLQTNVIFKLYFLKCTLLSETATLSSQRGTGSQTEHNGFIKKKFIWRRTQHILFTVIWRQIYSKRPLR